MRNPGGCIVWEGWHGELEEKDTFTCGHCNRIVPVPPGSPMVTVGAFCRVCGTHICGPLHDHTGALLSEGCEAKMNRTLTCRPFEKWLDRKEGKQHARDIALAAERRDELADKFRRIVRQGDWPTDTAAMSEERRRRHEEEFRARIDLAVSSMRKTG